MATSSVLKEIKDNFFECSICLNQFNEPKQLPCLHRFCRNCLKELIHMNNVTFNCPICKHVCDIKKDGVEAFKTDFHMKSLLQFIQLQKTVKNEEVRECIGCSKEVNVTAYCFKCSGFLCGHCYEFHMNNMMVRDHRQNILALKDVDAKNITVEKLASLTEAPRCQDHVEELSKLCCGTCDNIPICMVCAGYGKHKSHDKHDVAELARAERDKLSQKLAILKHYEENIYKLPKHIEDVTNKLNTNINLKLNELKSQLKNQTTNINKQKRNKYDKCKEKESALDSQQIHDTANFNKEREKKIQKTNDKYDNWIIENNAKIDKKRKENKKNYHMIDEELSKQLEAMNEEFNDLKFFIKNKQIQNCTKIEEISNQCENGIKRYENVKKTTSSILDTKNKWTDTQCIPDIRAATDPLIELVKKRFPELESLSDFTFGDLRTVNFDSVTLTENVEYVVDINAVSGMLINGITSIGYGRVVVTSRASDYYSHITVINMKEGETQRQGKMKQVNRFPDRYCASLSAFKIATVCNPNEIGICDVQDGSYIKKNISDVISGCSADQCVACVAVDHVTKHIIVGCYQKRDVYVFDDQLNDIHTLTLPQMIKWPMDITVHAGNLLVCDRDGKRAYAFSMEGSEVTMVYEFIKPDGDDWYPLSACIDKNRFIYMLWRATMYLLSGKSILVQYSQDGRQLLTTRQVDQYACCISAVETDEGEKLMVATFSTMKLITFGLVKGDKN